MNMHCYKIGAVGPWCPVSPPFIRHCIEVEIDRQRVNKDGIHGNTDGGRDGKKIIG